MLKECRPNPKRIIKFPKVESIFFYQSKENKEPVPHRLLYFIKYCVWGWIRIHSIIHLSAFDKLNNVKEMGDSQVVGGEEEKLHASVIINRNPFFPEGEFTGSTGAVP